MHSAGPGLFMQWYTGAMVQHCNDAMVQWSSGAMVHRHEKGSIDGPWGSQFLRTLGSKDLECEGAKGANKKEHSQGDRCMDGPGCTGRF